MYEVEAGKSKTIRYPDRAWTGGIHTCVGIGVLDTRKRVGHLLHAYAEQSWDIYLTFIDESMRETQPQDCRIAFAGVAPLTLQDAFENPKLHHEWLEQTRAFRQWLVEVSRAHGIPEKHIACHFGDHPNIGLRMLVDTAMDHIVVKKERRIGSGES